MVAIKPIGGLGSRMKCIASFGAIASHFNVPLHVYWNTSAGFEKIECDALFESFPDNVQWIDGDTWNVLRASNERVVKLDERISYLTRNYMFSDYKLHELFLTRKAFRLTAECNRDLQKLYGNVLRRFIPTFHSCYLRNLSAFVPVPAVRKLVAHEVKCWGDATTNVLGVHLRRNDALYSRVSNKYVTPTDQQMKEAIDTHLAHNPHPQAKTNEKAEANEDDPAPTHLVFLAVDDPDSFSFFKNAYQNEPRVRWYRWNRYKHKATGEKGGQLKALVDLTTLRCCNRVIGTTFSVFNEVAKVALVRSVVLHTYCAQLPSNCTRETVHTLVQQLDDEVEPAVAEPTVTKPVQPDQPNPKTKTSTPAELKPEPKPELKPSETNETRETNDSLPPPQSNSSASPAPKEANHTTPPDTTQDLAEPKTATKSLNEDLVTDTLPVEPEPLPQPSTQQPAQQSIPRKTIEYLYNANPDANAFQKQMQELLGLSPQANHKLT